MPPSTSLRLLVAALRPRGTLSARLQIVVRQSNLRAYPNQQDGFLFFGLLLRPLNLRTIAIAQLTR